MPLFALATASGSLSGSLLFQSSSIFRAALAACVASLVLAILIRRARPAIAFAFVVAVFFFGGALLAVHSARASSSIPVPMGGDSPYVCDGEVASAPRPRQWGAQVEVELRACSLGAARPFSDAGGAVLLTVKREDADLAIGERIRFRATFGQPREFKNPGGFSYRRYLMIHGIGATGKIYGRAERLGRCMSLAQSFEEARGKIAASLDSVLAGPERGIVKALAIGDQDDISPEMRDVFADTGLAHILAISGLNVGYVAACLYFLSRLLFGRFPRLLLRVPLQRLAAALTLPALWGYVMLTGSVVSAVRAGIMLSVFLIGVLAGRRQDLLSTLATSVVVILFATPLAILDVSFQLSVVAVAGLILIAPLFIRAMGGISEGRAATARALNWLRGLVAVSAAATLATAPLVAYHFKFVTAVGVVANLVAVPLSGALLSPPVAAAEATALVSHAAAVPLWRLSGLAARMLIGFARACEASGAVLVFRWAPSALDASLIYLAMAAVVFWRHLPYKKAVAVSIAMLVAFDAGYFGMLPGFDPKLSITILDVGQGDSALIRFPDGRTMLIDGGGIKGSAFDVGRHIVTPALLTMGVHKLDWALLTHPHHDHYRGLGYVAAEFKPERVWMNGLDSPDAERGDWDAFLLELGEARVPVDVAADAVRSMDVGGATVRIIKPPCETGEDLNDSSLVVDVRYGAHRFLFVGDLTQNGEQKILKEAGDLSATFLKVGHHGSSDASSSIFLDAVKPEIAAISVGEHNVYGMPSSAALGRLRLASARILRTDIDGAITLTSDGKELSVETFVKR